MTAGDSAAGRICGPSSALLAMTNPLSALSPLDGRYAGKVDALREPRGRNQLCELPLAESLLWH